MTWPEISLKHNNDNKAAVKYFCCGFMGRCPQLTWRNAQSTPLTRGISANLKFYDSFQNLDGCWQTHTFAPSHTFNAVGT